MRHKEDGIVLVYPERAHDRLMRRVVLVETGNNSEKTVKYITGIGGNNKRMSKNPSHKSRKISNQASELLHLTELIVRRAQVAVMTFHHLSVAGYRSKLK